MHKQDKIRQGKIKKLDKTDKQQKTGVFKTDNHKPESPDFKVVHQQNGINIYLYGFDSYERATKAWFTLVQNLQNERL